MLAVLVVTVQTVVISQIHLLGASPDLVVLCAVVGGLVGGPQRGTVAGFVFGLVYDLALTTPFGLWALVLCVTGFAVGLTRNEASVTTAGCRPRSSSWPAARPSSPTPAWPRCSAPRGSSRCVSSPPHWSSAPSTPR